MTELRKVTRSVLAASTGTSARIIAVVVVGHPHRDRQAVGQRPTAPAAVVAAARPPPTATPPPPVHRARPRRLRLLTFGTNEPPPGWEIWPAGNLASFRFAMRIDLSPQPGDRRRRHPSPTTPPIASPGLGAVPVVVADHPDPGRQPPRPDRPQHARSGTRCTSVTLRRLDVVTAVPTLGRHPADRRGPTTSRSSGSTAAGGGGSMQAWPAGHYRLDVVIDPGT